MYGILRSGMKTGDVVASVTQPITKSIDAIWGTDLANCQKCHKMQSDLNNAETVWDFFDAVKERFKQKEN